ncbi:hypothetical protein [Amycolatopsis sp. cmx-8-4]|uniref:hypothetical protein n=1 Tax=Amycolatopsis sp. cmx-8-4 TaxID=2790947 RepID=UPI00397D8028
MTSDEVLARQLVEELKELRKATGADPVRLMSQKTLTEHLDGVGKPLQARERLRDLIYLITENDERVAVLNALGLASTPPGVKEKRNLTERRNTLADTKKMGVEKSVERRENSGFEALALIILEQSPLQPDAQGNRLVSSAQRIADLELTVSMLGRIIYSLMNDLPEWRQGRIDESIRTDLESYELSLAKVVWRGSDNGKAAISMFADDLTEKLNDQEINPLAMLEHLRTPKPINLSRRKPIDSDSETPGSLDEVDDAEVPERDR